MLARKSLGKPLKPEIRDIGSGLLKRGREAGALLLATVGVYLLLVMFSFHAGDPSWDNNIPSDEARNLGGVVGAWLAYTLYFLFGGPSAILFPLAIFVSAWFFFRERGLHRPLMREHLVNWFAFLLTMIASCSLATLHFAPGLLPATAGGRIGVLIAESFFGVFGMTGATLLLVGLVIVGFTLMTGISWFKVMDLIGAFLFKAVESAGRFTEWLRRRRTMKETVLEREQTVLRRQQRLRRRTPPKIEPTLEKLPTGKRVAKERQITLPVGEAGDELPPLDLLDEAPVEAGTGSGKDLEMMARQLEIKLEDFGITGEVVETRPGPVITCFEVNPAPGTKASRISSLEKDLARSLSVPSLRVVEVIPGKSSIGIEIPNENRAVVMLGELLRSAECEKASSPLTLALGKDTSGHPMFTDLEKMPHLLVAGTTGSGKSVAVHAMLMSLLTRNRPAQVRLLLVDPKMLELKTYDGLPHLLSPVITDMKEAVNALHWGVVEMERRYRLMAALGARNITAYNRLIRDAEKDGKPLTDPLVEDLPEDADVPVLAAMPYIVVVIDEFADMIMVVGRKVEDLIVRLAQKARAAGIHLVLATQRPSVDIITGLVKANVPARIAFQVSSKVDSRTILDQNGAEQLLGQGDMLFLPAGQGAPTRIHGAFVADHEVQEVTAFLRTHGRSDYLKDLVEAPVPGNAAPGFEDLADSNSDPLYDEAVAVVTELRKASISYLQRRLKVGYNRAARMIEEMEAAGIVSPVQPNGGREVLAAPPPEQ